MVIDDEEDQGLDGLSDEGRSQSRAIWDNYGWYQGNPQQTSRPEYYCGEATLGGKDYCTSECKRTGICIKQPQKDSGLQSNDLINQLQLSIENLAKANHKLQLSLESANRRYVFSKFSLILTVTV